MKSPPPTQTKIVDFIKKFMLDFGIPPSVRDIQHGCSISSTSVVNYNLNRLKEQGKLRRLPNVSRGIELVDEMRSQDDESTPYFLNAANNQAVPLMGYISAGSPIPMPASDDSRIAPPLGYINLPSQYPNSSKSLYALRVRGISMKDALVDDGDVVIIDPARQVQNGDMAISWLKAEEEATLKKIYYKGNTIVLQPANSEMTPLVVNRENIDIQGKVIGVLRFLEDMIS